MTIKNKPTASEMLEILNQPWIGTEEIKRLACVGNDKARKIKTKIKEQLLDEGYILPSSNVVPTEKVAEYLKINIKYLKKVAG